MRELELKIGHRTYKVYGASADLIAWAEKSTSFDALLGRAGVRPDDLYVALGSPSDDRISRSKLVIQKVWGAHPELGPYPFLEKLSQFEFDRIFYRDYRDHVSHQLKVLLLGLMIYEGCSRVREAIDETLPVGDGRAFLRRWLVTAVYHDIGYVLENEHANDTNQKAWRETRDAMNAVLRAPLSQLAALRPKLTEEMERQVVKDARIYTAVVDNPVELEKDGDQDLFELLREDAERAGVAAPRGDRAPRRIYYEYAFSHVPLGSSRPRFRDHGIASALILLRNWRAFRDYLARIAGHLGNPLLADARADIEGVRRELDAGAVRDAAGAMALHNLNRSLWDAGESVAHGLTLANFSIRLTDPQRRTPLAFLLGVADSLQDWDRRRFRPEQGGYLDQDLSVRAASDRIWLFIADDHEKFVDPATAPESGYRRAVEAMKEYLEPGAVDGLLRWGEPPPDAGPAALRGRDGGPVPPVTPAHGEELAVASVVLGPDTAAVRATLCLVTDEALKLSDDLRELKNRLARVPTIPAGIKGAIAKSGPRKLFAEPALRHRILEWLSTVPFSAYLYFARAEDAKALTAEEVSRRLLVEPVRQRLSKKAQRIEVVRGVDPDSLRSALDQLSKDVEQGAAAPRIDGAPSPLVELAEVVAGIAARHLGSPSAEAATDFEAIRTRLRLAVNVVTGEYHTRDRNSLS